MIACVPARLAWHSFADVRCIVLAMSLIVLLFGCRADTDQPRPRPEHDSACSQCQLIWTTPPEAALRAISLLQLYTVGLGPGDAVARRFQAPASGHHVRGAFYIVMALFYSRPGLDVVVSVCADTNGRLGDIASTRLCATRVTARLPLGYRGEWDLDDRASAPGSSPSEIKLPNVFDSPPYEVDFSMPCKLKRGNWYWLTIEPRMDTSAKSWDEEPMLLVLATSSSPLNSVQRSWIRGAGGKRKNWDRPCRENLAAELEVGETP
jgi:hypothetical protein